MREICWALRPAEVSERSQRSACCQPYHSIRSIIQRSIAVLAALSKIAGLSSVRAFALGLNCSNLQTSINKLRHWAFMDAENIGNKGRQVGIIQVFRQSWERSSCVHMLASPLWLKAHRWISASDVLSGIKPKASDEGKDSRERLEDESQNVGEQRYLINSNDNLFNTVVNLILRDLAVCSLSVE